ncbi:hypothetical protein ABPG75_010843 [Micractinium tetrahymenae]
MAAPYPSDDAPISLLDDELLGRCFAAAGTEQGPAITLVCKRWREVFNATPALWRCFTLNPQLHQKSCAQQHACLAALHGLLQRVAPHVTSFSIAMLGHIDVHGGPLGWPALRFLRLLQPSVLASLSLLHLPADAPATCEEAVRELLRHPQLTALELSQAWCSDADAVPLPASLAHALDSLPHLRALSLSTSLALPEGLLAAVQRLQGLTRLSLEAKSLPPLGALTTLCTLLQLELSDWTACRTWLLAAVQRLQGLTRLSLEAKSLPPLGALTALCTLLQLELSDRTATLAWQAAAGEEAPPLQPPLPADFPGGLLLLKCSAISRRFQVAGVEVQGLSYSCCPAQHDAAQHSAAQHSVASVEFDGLKGSASLHQLLAGLLPDGLSLERLAIKSLGLEAATLQGCPALASLRSARLELCFSQVHAITTALLAQAPGLRELDLHTSLRAGGNDDAPGALPAALVAARGIRSLKLTWNDLSDLPAGPYLLDLEELDCCDNQFKRLPRALAAATSLRRLSLSNLLQVDCPVNDELNFELSAADVEEVLASMPRLTRLDLGYSRVPLAVLQRLRAAAPQLEVAAAPLPEMYDPKPALQKMLPARPEAVAALLGEAVRRCLRTEVAPGGVAALARGLFPHAASLRVSLLTGDPSVLACLGSLLAPGPLRLALLPTGASAAGAAVLRRAPIYLTAEIRETQGLACYDFEGGSVFALPLLETPGVVPLEAAAGVAEQQGTSPAAPPEAQAAQQAQQAQQPRCVGAVLLSFPAAAPAARQPPAGLDAAHARNLQLLAAALAPGAAAAAAPLLGQCDLLLGVQPAGRPGAEEEEDDEEGSSSDVSVMLTDSEGEEEEAWEEGGVAAPGGSRAAASEHAAAAAAAEAEGEQPLAPPLPWAAGACRGGSDEPPEDPGASSAAVLAAPAQHESEGEPSGHGGSRWQRAQHAQQAPLPLPESPSVAKARARVEAARLEAAAAPHPAASSVSSGGAQSSLGSLHTASSWSLQHQPAKVSPGPSEEESDSPRSVEEVPLERLAGATWARLLRFADPRLEACFADRLAAELWKARTGDCFGQGWLAGAVGQYAGALVHSLALQSDATTLSLCLALQLALLCSSSTLGGAQPGWGTPLALAFTAAVLALVFAAKPFYLRHRDGLVLLLTWLGWAWWQWPQGLLTRSRLCVQAQLQGLLIGTAAASLLRGCVAPVPGAPMVALSLAFSLLPLMGLSHLESRARRCFLAAAQHLTPVAG